MSIRDTNDGYSRVNHHVTNEDYNAAKYYNNADYGTYDGCTPNERIGTVTRSQSGHYYGALGHGFWFEFDETASGLGQTKFLAFWWVCGEGLRRG